MMLHARVGGPAGGIEQHVRKTCVALVAAHAIKTVIHGSKEHLPLNRECFVLNKGPCTPFKLHKALLNAHFGRVLNALVAFSSR
jgi:hypothetical protein